MITSGVFGSLNEDEQKEVYDYLVKATELDLILTGFKPDEKVLAAGAVRTNSYDYFESQIVQYVVLAKRDVDLVDGEREFTDWDALGAEVGAFLHAAPPKRDISPGGAP